MKSQSFLLFAAAVSALLVSCGSLQKLNESMNKVSESLGDANAFVERGFRPKPKDVAYDAHTKLDYLAALGYIMLYSDREFSDGEWLKLLEFYDRDQYKNVKDDEFRRQAALREFEGEMFSKVANINYEGRFELGSTQYFGEYDFEGEFFPVKELGSSSYFTIRFSGWSGGIAEMQVILKNAEDFNYIPMNPEEASSFIDSRKNYNSINRSVSMLLIVEFVPFDDPVLVNMQSILRLDEYHMMVSIVEAIFYDGVREITRIKL